MATEILILLIVFALTGGLVFLFARPGNVGDKLNLQTITLIALICSTFIMISNTMGLFAHLFGVSPDVGWATSVFWVWTAYRGGSVLGWLIFIFLPQVSIFLFFATLYSRQRQR